MTIELAAIIVLAINALIARMEYLILQDKIDRLQQEIKEITNI